MANRSEYYVASIVSHRNRRSGKVVGLEWELNSLQRHYAHVDIHIAKDIT